MSYASNFTTFQKWAAERRAHPRLVTSPLVTIFKLIAGMLVHLRWLMSTGPVFAVKFVHEIGRGKYLPCTNNKEGTGECKLCRLMDEALTAGRVPKIVARWRSKAVTIAYAQLFDFQNGNKEIMKRNNTVLFVCDGNLYEILDNIVANNEEILDPNSEECCWELSTKGKDTKIRLRDDMKESMEDLPDSMTPIEQMWFAPGSEVSEKDLAFARKVFFKNIKTNTAV